MVPPLATDTPSAQAVEPRRLRHLALRRLNAEDLSTAQGGTLITYDGSCDCNNVTSAKTAHSSKVCP